MLEFSTVAHPSMLYASMLIFLIFTRQTKSKSKEMISIDGDDFEFSTRSVNLY